MSPVAWDLAAVGAIYVGGLYLFLRSLRRMK